jgi:hypothetical protein
MGTYLHNLVFVVDATGQNLVKNENPEQLLNNGGSCLMSQHLFLMRHQVTPGDKTENRVAAGPKR